MDEENTILENAIFPNGLVTIPDVDGHADTKFAIGFVHKGLTTENTESTEVSLLRVEWNFIAASL